MVSFCKQCIDKIYFLNWIAYCHANQWQSKFKTTKVNDAYTVVFSLSEAGQQSFDKFYRVIHVCFIEQKMPLIWCVF